MNLAAEPYNWVHHLTSHNQKFYKTDVFNDRSFIKCDFRGCTFEGMDSTMTVFDKCNLRDTKWIIDGTKCNIDFSKCNLTGADFSKCSIETFDSLFFYVDCILRQMKFRRKIHLHMNTSFVAAVLEFEARGNKDKLLAAEFVRKHPRWCWDKFSKYEPKNDK